ncbi:Arc family DNA-binding protein [Flavonifractor sp. An4]|uniref:Arc family DNA-binding protein n=1 Tax=Flavonifractor sp. An4 TaxID=1965634 RepID=UPI000B395B2C|nr:Arc family DNA-binding protein [Flavonifractor sp. An4]OUO05359.1 hypothetical protein B5F94_15880 [Flavonifractor sp. An4]
MTVSKAQIAAVGRYEAKAYDKILLRLPKGERDRIQEAAEAAGLSVNAWIKRAIEKEFDRA